MPTTEENVFFSLFQMNERFTGGGHESHDDFEYAELTLIITKVVKVPVKGKAG